MLLRNLDTSNGLCNDTRMICRGFSKNFLHAKISSCHSATKYVFLLKIQLSPPENEGYQFKFIRPQFLVRFCFEMTINKAQGQTIQILVCIFPNMFPRMVNCTLCSQEEYLCPQHCPNRATQTKKANIIKKHRI